MKNRIGIIGYGFVGKAIFEGFNKNVNKLPIDPVLNNSIKDLEEFQPDYIFISVPTPMSSDGSQDTSIIDKVFEDISLIEIDPIIIIKSTVLPNNLEKIKIKYNKIVYNPEFLREVSSYDDFKETTKLILGGERELTEQVKNLYTNHSICKIEEVFYLDLIAASIVKYSINSFLALKVIFFNQLKDIYDQSNSKDSWFSIIRAINSDERIGNSHMNVPGHDDKFGFGGACFPKDTAALYKLSHELGVEFTLLHKAITINEALRSDYDDLEEREKEQNIDFNIFK